MQDARVKLGDGLFYVDTHDFIIASECAIDSSQFTPSMPHHGPHLSGTSDTHTNPVELDSSIKMSSDLQSYCIATLPHSSACSAINQESNLLKTLLGKHHTVSHL